MVNLKSYIKRFIYIILLFVCVLNVTLIVKDRTKYVFCVLIDTDMVSKKRNVDMEFRDGVTNWDYVRGGRLSVRRDVYLS